MHAGVVSSTTIKVTAPARAAGTVTVAVTTLGGVHYTYDAAPHITTISPPSGGYRTEVTIHGTGFTGATAVAFGSGHPGSNVTVSTSGTKITVRVPFLGFTTERVHNRKGDSHGHDARWDVERRALHIHIMMPTGAEPPALRPEVDAARSG